MIAVVTSTIKPVTPEGQSPKSFYAFGQRLQQTKETLAALQQNGFKQIFLIDNSPDLDETDIKALLNGYPVVNIYHVKQYQFINKGINELLMLLYLCPYLPAGTTIFKISGRYKPTAMFQKPVFKDFAFKAYDFTSRTGTLSTRAYWIKDAGIYEEFLLRCLNELYAYPERVKGFKGLLKALIFTIRGKSTPSLNISIEFAAANVLKQNSYHFTPLDILGIEGLVAGSHHLERISE